jgi:hypothetical protein
MSNVSSCIRNHFGLIAFLFVFFVSSTTVEAYFSASEYFSATSDYPIGRAIAENESAESSPTYFLGFFPVYQAEILVLLVIVSGLIAVIVLLFLFIFFNRLRKTRIRDKEYLMKVVYQEQLTNYIYGEDDQNILFQGLNKYSNRQIFINEMMWLHRNLYGETANRLHDLYFNLDLYSHSLRNLSSNRWAVKARGFRELAQMEVKEVARDILGYVNSKNQVLRVEAQLAMVKLNPDDPLGFFDNLKLPLSKWEQLNILNTLQHNEVKIESFERWMDSENDSVVIFSIKMAGLFNHIHSWTKILELVYHGNSEVRRIAIETLGLFELTENLEMFKDFYRNHLPVEENEDDVFYNLKMSKNRLAAIEALEKIVTESDVPFFKFVLRNEKEFVILQETVNVLDAISNGNVSVWDEAYDHVEPKVQMIIDQKR